MFKEIVSQISFSPAMVERLSVYARVIKRRQRISGWSLILVTALFAAQVMAAIVPTPSTNASQEPTSQSSDTFISDLHSEEPTATPTLLSQFNSMTENLPVIDDAIILSFYGACLVINLLTYLSLRLHTKEIRIIRTQLNAGGL